MNAIAAFSRFSIMLDEGLTYSWPQPCKDAGEWGPLGMAAAAVVSGWLPDVQEGNDEELVAAAQHGITLVASGVITDLEYCAAADAIREKWKSGCRPLRPELCN